MLPAFRNKKWFFVSVSLLLVSMAFGLVGWMKTLEKTLGHPHPVEAIYKTLELLHWQMPLIVEEVKHEHWTLTVGKIGVRFALFLVVIQSGALIFQRQIRRWRFRKAKNHSVFVGLGGLTGQLALSSARNKKKVACVCNDSSHPLRTELESAGALFLHADPTDREALSATNLSGAARVLVDCGHDEASVKSAEIAAALLATSCVGSNRLLMISVRSGELRNTLGFLWRPLRSHGSTLAKVIGFQSVALRRIASNLAVDLILNPAVRGRGARILAVGSWDFAEDFLRVAVPVIQVSAENRPVIAVCLDDNSSLRSFLKSCPELHRVADIRCIEGSPSSISTARELLGLEFDAAVTCMGSEVETLKSLERIVRASAFRVEKLIAVTELPVGLELVHDERVQFWDVLTHGLEMPEFDEHALEEEARRNHSLYIEGLSVEDRNCVLPWEELEESVKESNRSAVLHDTVKVAFLKAFNGGREQAISFLERCEHQRWVAERVISGWVQGPIKDTQRKLHPSIVSFDNLPPGERAKDRTQLIRVLERVD